MLPLAGRQRERTLTKAQTQKETGVLEGTARTVVEALTPSAETGADSH